MGEALIKAQEGDSFKVGDKVVYSAQGVGVIDGIQETSLGGVSQNFYKISILESGARVMVPVRMAASQGLRKVVDASTIEKVYDILRQRKVEVDTQTWNRRFRQYKEKIKTGSVFEIATVIRDLTVLKGDKELSSGEKDMLRTARGRLIKEISIAKSIPEESAQEELLALCEYAN